jgi:hypothetical protein
VHASWSKNSAYRCFIVMRAASFSPSKASFFTTPPTMCS